MKFKRIFSLNAAAILALNMVTVSVYGAKTDTSLLFDFNNSDNGFTAIFSDYPNSEGVEEFYEFKHEYGEIPISGAGNGIFISGNNHSDDLFMGYVKKLEGFVPEKNYHFTVSFKLATDVDSGLFGAGGSPGESVSVKCGITSIEPVSTVAENSGIEYYRMNIDKGSQSNSGNDMVVVGDMSKIESNHLGAYEFKNFHAEFDISANSRGEVYLIIGTDSGFEATTSYYLDDISVNWTDAKESYVTRGEAAQMLFDIADRPSADVENCIFGDVDTTSPYAEAIVWAEQNGYLSGYGNGLFGPNDKMTIEQAMVMIYRFLGTPAVNNKFVLNKFEDSDQISVWAKDAIVWMIENELFKPDKEISPKSQISKEQLVYATSQIAVAC